MRSYSARRAWCVSQRSTSCCKPSHISGDVPKARARRCAMSVVTGLRSCRISLTVRRESPSTRASLSCVNPAAGRTSSRRISPGMRRSSLSIVQHRSFTAQRNQLPSSTIFDQFQCADGVDALKHAELIRKANEVVSLVPTSEPFISGIDHHRANARLP